jgi:hypothetical protein
MYTATHLSPRAWYPQLSLDLTVSKAKKVGRDWMNRIHKKTLGIWNWTQTDKGTFCQKNEGSIEIKQIPVKMGGSTVCRILPPKVTPFQTRIDR